MKSIYTLFFLFFFTTLCAYGQPLHRLIQPNELDIERFNDCMSGNGNNFVECCSEIGLGLSDCITFFNLGKGKSGSTTAIVDVPSIRTYPNPFNTTVNLAVELPEAANITVEVYDITGKKVLSILQESFHEAGKSTISIDTNDLPKGLYYCRLKINNYTIDQKMIKS